MTTREDAIVLAAIVALMVASHGGSLGAQSASIAPTAEARADRFAIPEGVTPLGVVRIPRATLADGKRLSPGTYRVRLSGETVLPVAGESPGSERWVEFLQGNQVKGRALAPVVSAAAVPAVTAGSSVPAPGRVRVQALRGGEYLRVWFNYGGDQVLVYLPYAP